jgi:hypothetical protein
VSFLFPSLVLLLLQTLHIPLFSPFFAPLAKCFPFNRESVLVAGLVLKVERGPDGVFYGMAELTEWRNELNGGMAKLTKWYFCVCGYYCFCGNFQTRSMRINMILLVEKFT